MKTLTTHRDLMDLWHSRAQLARILGVKAGLVRIWYQRNKIPADHWITLGDAAKRCGFKNVTYASISALKHGKIDEES